MRHRLWAHLHPPSQLSMLQLFVSCKDKEGCFSTSVMLFRIARRNQLASTDASTCVSSFGCVQIMPLHCHCKRVWHEELSELQSPHLELRCEWEWLSKFSFWAVIVSCEWQSEGGRLTGLYLNIIVITREKGGRGRGGRGLMSIRTFPWLGEKRCPFLVPVPFQWQNIQRGGGGGGGSLTKCLCSGRAPGLEFLAALYLVERGASGIRRCVTICYLSHLIPLHPFNCKANGDGFQKMF